MGLRHVLEHYLRGLRVGPAELQGLPDLDGELRDMQFESAWRMCEWDPALAVSGVRGGQGVGGERGRGGGGGGSRCSACCSHWPLTSHPF